MSETKETKETKEQLIKRLARTIPDTHYDESALEIVHRFYDEIAAHAIRKHSELLKKAFRSLRDPQTVSIEGVCAVIDAALPPKEKV
jgi:hypothetical protein